MKTFIVGVILGVLAATGIFIPILVHEQKAKYEFGKMNGRIDALQEAASILGKEFGYYKGCFNGKTPFKELFEVKATSVLMIETNGVKTIKVIP